MYTRDEGSTSMMYIIAMNEYGPPHLNFDAERGFMHIRNSIQYDHYFIP
jgi:hypothetical protein